MHEHSQSGFLITKIPVTVWKQVRCVTNKRLDTKILEYIVSVSSLLRHS